MLKKFLKETSQATSIVVGLACANLALEALRTPAVRNVTFEVFHPLPYLVEGLALILMALALRKASCTFRITQHPIISIGVGAAASLSLFLIMQAGDTPTEASSKSIAAAMYRFSSAALFVLWAEKLFHLGARRAACAYALSLLAAAAILATLSLCSLTVGQAVLATLPLLSMGLLLSLSGEGQKSSKEQASAETSVLDEKLPALKIDSKRNATIVAILLFSPLAMRGPFVSVQSSWLGQQSGDLASFLIQTSMALGFLLGCILVVGLLRYLWNKRCVMFFNLLIVPLSLLAFYAAQASEALWFFYVPVIDATYRTLLLFVILMPFLVKTKNSFCLMPLGFGVLITGRVPFSFLVLVLPSAVYAGISVLIVTLGIIGSITALLASGLFEDEKAPNTNLPGIPKRNNEMESACNLLAEQRKLTGREREVLGLLSQRYNAPYIAKKLVLSQSTVKTHMRNLYAKLEVHSQSDLYLLLENTTKNMEEGRYDL